MKLRACVAVTLLLLSVPAAAQTPELTDEQLELLLELSPEERQALLDQILGDESEAGVGAALPGVLREGGAERPPEEMGELPRLPTGRREGAALRGPYALFEEKEPQLEGGSEILVDLDEPEPEPAGTLPAPTGAPPPQRIPEAEQLRRDAVKERIRRGNPYRLDSQGRIQLPGFEPIPLLGLTEKLAAKRLAADPDLAAFRIRVTQLPEEGTRYGVPKPFGYDLFSGRTSRFAPGENIPVPADYVVGPGDRLRVQLFGTTNRTLRLQVGRDGQIEFPQIGPIGVAGMPFEGAKENIESRVAAQMIGVRANVELAETRSIRVFLLGEVARPGSYTVSGLSTVTHALTRGGGISPIGSLRSVQLKRAGKVVETLDLYDLLLAGDTSGDVRLQPGDAIFIPPLGGTVAVTGEVLRPALYEFRPRETVADALRLAGGVSARADEGEARLERVNERGERVVLNVDLQSAQARALPLRKGDVLRVLPIRNTLEGAVVVEGHVLRPSSHGYRPGLRISDVLAFDDLKPNADSHYVLIRRELPPDQRVVVISADLAAAHQARKTERDIPLEPRDRLIVFDVQTGRERVMEPLLRQLRSQATRDAPLQVVGVVGRVRAPGEYPLEPGMRVSDLLRAGGSLEDAAYGGTAELTRYELLEGESRQTELIEIDLASLRSGDAAADLALRPYDMLTVKEIPQWSGAESVQLIGEVRFPGTYSLQRGETLSSVVGRAGGLTDLAFAEGAIFTRETLRLREQEQLDRLEARLRRDLAVLALRGGATGTQVPSLASVGSDLLQSLQTAQAVGRLVINLDAAISGPPGGPDDVALKRGDVLMVPRRSQEVSVMGEVNNPTSHRYDQHLGREDYLDLSGGLTSNADDKRIYVVAANGSVRSQRGGAWFETSPRMRPGDTIVVPLDVDRIRALPLWTSVTQILYQIAIAAAAVAAL